jgi:hypothetical protein
LALEDQLVRRAEALGRRLGELETSHRDEMERARQLAQELHAASSAAVESFASAAQGAGAPELEFEIGTPRLDDKHIRAIEFDLRRGRHGAVVTVKAKGEVTLVGPFRIGKAEGPCSSFPMDSREELEAALGDFLERFLELSMSP